MPDTIDTPKPISTVVVAREEHIPESMLAATPGLFPDVILKAMSPVAVIVVRALRVYFQTILGCLTAGGFTGVFNVGAGTGDFWHLVRVSATVAGCAAFFCVLQNTVELLTKLDQSMPQLRA